MSAKRNKRASNVLAGLVATAVFAAYATCVRAEDIKIGLIGTYSGPYARFGRQYDQAIAAYTKMYGDSVNGNRIVIIKRDDGGPDAAKGRLLAEELILREKVSFLAGFTWTPNTIAAAQLVTQTKTPAIIFNAATGSLMKTSPYFIRTSYTLGQGSQADAEWAIQNHINKVVTIVSDYAPGQEGERVFLAKYSELGGKVLESIRVPLSATDFSPFYERAGAAKPDAVFAFAPNAVSEANTWAARLKPSGIKLLSTTEMTETEAISFSKDAVGIISGSHYTEGNPSPLNQKFRATLTQLFGPETTPDQFSVGAFDGMHVIYEILKKLGPHFNPDDAMKLAQGMQFDSPRGRFHLDGNRDVINDIDIRRLEERDGRLINVILETIKDVKPTS